MTLPTTYMLACTEKCLPVHMWLLETCAIPTVCTQASFGTPNFYGRAKKWTILYQMAADVAQESDDGQGENPVIVHYA